MASWLVCSTPERAVQVQALAGDIVLCSFKTKTLYSHSASLPPPRCINGYHQIVGENLTNCGEVTCNGLASCPGEVEIPLATSCYRNWDKLLQLLAPRLHSVDKYLSIVLHQMEDIIY